MSEDLGFHIPMGPWCESANDRIADLEAKLAIRPFYPRSQTQYFEVVIRADKAEAALAQRDRMLDCVQGMLREIRDASTVLGVRVGMQGALDNLADLRARAEE